VGQLVNVTWMGPPIDDIAITFVLPETLQQILVYKKWTPKSRDLATYVRDLVIGDFRKVLRSKAAFEKEVDRLVTALAEG
jgi:hypothetical protein